MLYKLVEGVLVSTETTKIISLNNRNRDVFNNDNFSPVRVDKTEEELLGFKPLRINIIKTPDIYENEIISYEEKETEIIENHNVILKTEEEIKSINEKFWNENYFQIMNILPLEFYAPYSSYLGDKQHDLLKDDYAVLLMAAASNQLPNLILYKKPDMTKKFDKDYFDSLKETITDTNLMGAILGYFGTLNYGERAVPTVI